MDSYSILSICHVLGINRSSYYFCRAERPKCRLALENKRLTEEIIRIYHEQDGIYGAPKIRQELLQLNLPFQVSEKRVQRIMKRLGLRSIVVKKFTNEDRCCLSWRG